MSEGLSITDKFYLLLCRFWLCLTSSLWRICFIKTFCCVTKKRSNQRKSDTAKTCTEVDINVGKYKTIDKRALTFAHLLHLDGAVSLRSNAHGRPIIVGVCGHNYLSVYTAGL